jgi:hypothetical protein
VEKVERERETKSVARGEGRERDESVASGEGRERDEKCRKWRRHGERERERRKV